MSAVVKQSQVNTEDLKAQLEAALAENAKLKAVKTPKPRALSLKVSAKGAVSVYGMGRFPVTLYREQWLRLLNFADKIRAFIEAHADELSEKN